jgi:hypothetical protein
MTLRTRLTIIGVLLVAWAARLNGLGDVPFWYDEGLVGWSARLSFLSTAQWTAADVHPPLYFWAVTVWRMLAGETEFALRLVSIACGFLSVLVVYKIGERLQGPALGSLAALFIGLARFHIWWSQELRMYILGSLLMLLSVWLTLRIAHGQPRRRDWFSYILVSAAGLWSLYLVAFALAFEALYVTLLLGLNLLRRRAAAQAQAAMADPTSMTVRKYLQWVAAQAVVALLFLPWFLYFLTQFRTWSDATPFDFKLFAQFYATMLAVGVPADIDRWLLPMAAIWAVLLLGALIGLRGRHEGAAVRGGWLIVLLLVLPPLTVYSATTPRSFFYSPRVEPRYLFPFIWSFYLVLAWSVWRIAQARRWLGIGAALVVIVLSLVTDQQYYAARIPNDVYQTLTATLRAHRLPGDGVVLDDDRTWPIFEYYYASGIRDWKGVPNGSRIKAGDVDFILKSYWEAHDAVWLVWNEDALRIDENHVLEQWLAAHSVYSRELTFGTKRLIFYARTAERARTPDALAAAARPAYALSAQLTDSLLLKGYDQAMRRYRAGDEILLGTFWQSRQSEQVTASLQDEHDVEHARQSLPIAPGDSWALLRYPVTTDLAADKYRVVVSVANRQLSLAQAEITEPAVAAASPDITIQTPGNIRFQNGIQLTGYDGGTTTMRPGDNLPLTLYWQTDQPVSHRYKVFVHLLGTAYNPKSKNLLWGQQDQEPLNGMLPTTSWGIRRVVSDPYFPRLAPDAPSGHYAVEIGFYEATSGERLPVLGDNGIVVSDHATLFEFDVT